MTELAILRPMVVSETSPSVQATDAVLARLRRRELLVLLLIGVIAALDFLLQRTNFAILYVAPLFLLVRRGDLRYPWQIAALLIGLTYGVFLLKNLILPLGDTPRFFDYRLVNRSLVVLMILAMTRLIEIWCRWRADQLDAEIPEALRYQDQEISATFAVLTCIPLAVAIALVDYLAPANINLAILYLIPLFVCGWTGSQRLLWSVLVALLVLTAIGSFWGGPSVAQEQSTVLVRNRLLAAAGMTCVASLLHLWMNEREAASRPRDG